MAQQSPRRPALGGKAKSKSKDASGSSRPGSPVFKLRPLQTELRPGQTVDMVLEGCSSTVRVRALPRAAPSLADPLHCGFFCSPFTLAWEKEEVTPRNCF